MKETLRTLAILLSLMAPAISKGQNALAETGNYPGTYGFNVAYDVYQAGSDAASADFQANELPTFNQFINTTLTEGEALSDISAVSLTPTILNLAHEHDVRMYFISEGAGYHNTLGVTEISSDFQTQTSSLVFPDASTVNNNYLDGDTAGSLSMRNANTPLLPGDFVDIGTVDAGTQLDFFLISNGANGGTDIYSPRASSNPDMLQHVVSYAVPGSPYLLIGFEDMYNLGDQDYNDLVFVLDIGAANVEALLASPEPATLALLACIGLLWFFMERKRQPALSPC